MIAAIAVGIAGLVLVAVATTIAGDRAMQRGIGELDPEARAFTVTFSPDLVPTAADLDRLNSTILGRLQRDGLGPTIRTVEFRALAAGDGRTVRFAGLDDLDQVARLVDGVWPTAAMLIDAKWWPSSAIRKSPASDRAVSCRFAPRAHHRGHSGRHERPGAERRAQSRTTVSRSCSPTVLLQPRRSRLWSSFGVRTRGRHRSSPANCAPSTSPHSSAGSVQSPPTRRHRVFMSPARRTSSCRSAAAHASPRTGWRFRSARLLVLFFGVAVLAGLGGRADHQRTASVAAPTWRESLGDRVLSGRRGSAAGHRRRDRRYCRSRTAGRLAGSIGQVSVAGACSVDRSTDRWCRGCAPSDLVAFLLIFAVLGVSDVHACRTSPSPAGQRCSGHRCIRRVAGDGRAWFRLHRIAQPRRRPGAGRRARARRRCARIGCHTRRAGGAAGDLDGQPATMAVDEADAGGGHRATPTVDRYRVVDRGDCDVLGAHVRVRLDPAIGIPRPSGVCRSVRLPCATRRITRSPAGSGAGGWLVDSRCRHDSRRMCCGGVSPFGLRRRTCGPSSCSASIRPRSTTCTAGGRVSVPLRASSPRRSISRRPPTSARRLPTTRCRSSSTARDSRACTPPRSLPGSTARGTN